MVSEMSVKLASDELGVDIVVISGVRHFSVEKTFDCGQCFRFDGVRDTQHEVEFSGVAYNRFISVAQDGDTVYIYNSSIADYENIWKHYLGLDEDYEAIMQDIRSRSDNPALDQAIRFGEGIRILRQEPWEAICSFIISQNNNIPRIKKIVEKLAAQCGEPINIPTSLASKVTEGRALCAFPSPSALCELSVDGLFALKTGFRAKYIFDAASRAVSGQIDYEYLKSSQSTEECINELCKIKGVGPKVASCALLFGFGKYDAFPIDVWIKKVISKYFSDTAEKFSPEDLGKYAGIAQQYLFYYERYVNSK